MKSFFLARLIRSCLPAMMHAPFSTPSTYLRFTRYPLLLLKKFPDLPSPGQGSQEAAPAPGEAEIQVYVNRGKTFIELESQGAYTTLKPHERLDWTVRWYLLPVEADVPSKDLMETVKTILHL